MKKLFGGLAGLLLILLLGLGGLLGSEAGSRWLLARVPGLQLEQFSGRLGGHWQAGQLRWQQDRQQLVIQSPRMAWQPACLLRLTLCLDQLQTGDIELLLPEQESGSGPLLLGDLRLPLRIELGQLQTGRVRYNQVEQLEQLQLQAGWTGAGLRLDRLQLRQSGLEIRLQGQLQTTGDWPVQLSGEAGLDALVQQPWTLALAVGGSLARQLTLNVDSQGYFPGQIEGRLAILDEQLPGQFRISSPAFRVRPDLPESLTLQALQLVAEGDLQQGYQLQGSGQFAARGGAIPLQLQGRLDARQAELEQLLLQAGPQQQLQLQASVRWDGSPVASARLHWQDFPWQRLYPMAAPPAVSLQQLEARLDYQEGHYQGQLDAALKGPEGPFSVKTPFRGDLQQLVLPDLAVVAGQGRLAGELQAGFARGIDWQARLTLSDLNPAYWLAELPGRLGGRLDSQGHWQDNRLQASAGLDLAGRLRNQPARLQLQANGAGQQWQLEQLLLRLGDNRIQGSGRWNRRLEGQFGLVLPALAQLWPGLSGQLRGELQLAGTAQAPQGRLQLTGKALAFQGQTMRQLSLSAALAGEERLSLQLNAGGLARAGTDYGQLHLSAEGRLAQHSVRLQLSGQPASARLALEGRWQNSRWQGRLLEADLSGQGQHWQLQQPLLIERLASGQLSLGAHCWLSGPASLCAESRQQLLPEPRLHYRLQHFPLASLARWLPDDLRWQAELNAELQLALPGSGPDGMLHIEAGPGRLQIRDNGQWLDFPYQALVVDSQLKPRQAETRLSFQSGTLGSLELQARVDPRKAGRPLQGTFHLSGIDLATARPFLPRIEQLAGQLEGSGTLGGSLQKPVVNGQLQLSGGQVAGSQLPTHLENLQIRVDIRGEQLQINGQWQAGPQGRGQLSGRADWSAAPQLAIALSGQQLPVTQEPYARLSVSPDLKIVLNDQRLAVTGRVEVPGGQIRIRQLPPSTVSVSGDTVLVGEDAPAGPPAASQALQMAMDITVQVGRQRLAFDGFGLKATVAGELHIGDNLDSRGELRLNDGRYQAYGQDLTVRKARILFTGALSQPYLDIEAVRSITENNETVTAGLKISGSASQPVVSVFAEPSMSQEQALSYLVAGHALGADTGDASLVARAALGLGVAGGASIAGSLAQRVGIRDFELNTRGVGDATSVVASGKVSDRLTLSYGVGVFDQSTTVGMRYQLTRRLFLEAASGLASSLDIFYRRDF